VSDCKSYLQDMLTVVPAATANGMSIDTLLSPRTSRKKETNHY